MEVHKVNLQLVVKTLKKLLLLLLFRVHVIRGITGQVSELIQVLHDGLVVLLELTELIPLPLQKSSGNIDLAETVFEVFPRENLVGGQMCLSGFPPSTSLASEVVSCKQDLLVGGNFRDFKIVLDGAEPIIRIQRLNGFGEAGWIGVLEVAKARTKSSSVIGLGSDIGSDLLQSRDTCLLNITGSLAVFHEKAKNLSHVRIRGWWNVGVATTTSSGTSVGSHPEVWVG